MATELALKVEDIILFSSKGKDRSKNDANNKIREDILTNLLNIDTAIDIPDIIKLTTTIIIPHTKPTPLFFPSEENEHFSKLKNLSHLELNFM